MSAEPTKGIALEKRPQPQRRYGEWAVVERLGSGGNGIVWRCSKPDGSEAAVKILTKVKKIAYSRFRAEVKILSTNTDVPGILPILARSLPKDLNHATPWFAMPLATPIEKWARDASPYQRVLAIAEAAETMAELHRRNIYHRDLKPANLVYYNDRCCVVDFGLVHYPGKEDLTGNGEQLGPKWTMAPEVRRKGASAAAGPSDVYSLAKSLWIILKDIPRGFDGEYNKNSDLAVAPLFPTGYSGQLDALLNAATSNEPDQRPSMEKFAAGLWQWAVLASDYYQRNPVVWRELFADLFPLVIPRQATWTNPEQIVAVLSRLGKSESLNHLFFPGGGGNDLKSVRLSDHEPGCIEMLTPRPNIVKPLKLTFEGFDNDPEWNYFRLEAAPLDPCPEFNASVESEEGDEGDEGDEEGTDIAQNDHELFESYDEEGTEISSSKYAPFDCWNYGEFEGKELPETARPVVRWLRGTFVIFSKTSFYNHAPGQLDAYDGRHNKMTEQEFREHIEQMRAIVKERNFDWLGLRRPTTKKERVLSSAVDLEH